MSKDLGFIKGRIEIPDFDKKESSYREDELTITSFSGGIGSGRMIQLTTPYGTDHIQLTQQQVKDLIQTLSEWID